MKFKTHNDKEINAGGTGLTGYIKVDYAILKKTFGDSTVGDGYKIDAEWEIEFPDGKVATIYNYKTGKNYNGRKGTPKTQITDWHIGGNDNLVGRRIAKILGLKFQPVKRGK